MIFLYFASDTFESRAKVLTDSIRKYHPTDLIVHMKTSDGPLGQYIPNMAKMRLQKALEVLESTRLDVVLIGADCELFAAIDDFVDYSYFNKDILLVPHVKSPLKDRAYMVQIYQTGHANADFIFLRNTQNTKAILTWLISVTEDGMKPGEFYEQTWLSALPFLFDHVGVIRHPGYNVGYWDINHINLAFRDNMYFVNDEPLVLFQYSGYVKGEPMKMSRHSKERCENPIAFKIYKDYDDRIDQ